jgi:putative ABC transport system permease protein
MTPHTPPGAWSLAWRQVFRDLRAGELRLLGLAVILAVTALSAVGFFASRLEGGLARDARALLGGDVVVASDQRLPPAFAAEATRLGLRTSETAGFPSMARARDERGGGVRLVAVKSVSASYPLRGRLQIERTASAAPLSVAQGPARGQVWVDPGVLDALGLAIGDTLMLGDLELRIDAVLRNEPDRGSGFLTFAPRVMLPADDLAATGLVQPASRVTWRLAVAAPAGRSAEAAIAAWQRWAEQAIADQKLRGVRMESMDSGRPEMRQTLDRANQFLRLVAVLAAMLAAVAVAIAARSFALRHLDACALLRVMGVPQRRIAAAYSLEFLCVGVGASAIGVGLGLALHLLFVQLLSGLVAADLPAPGWPPAAFGLGIGLCLLTAFGLPPVLQLARVPPLPASLSIGVMGAGLIGFAALLGFATGDVKLGSIAVGGFALAWGLFAGVAWLAVKGLRRSVPQARAPRWLLLATRQLSARPGLAVMQVSALALGLTALALLVLIRTDLISSWRQATPASTPDRFVINIQPDQAEAFKARLGAAGIAAYDWYPMLRARLIAVNDREISVDDYRDERARRLVDREFNLSHAADLPDGNRLSGGTWVPDEADAVSVEQGLADTLGLKLGDRLRFDLAGTPVSGRITSLRKVDWTTMRVNFFVILPVRTLEDLPLTYISAFRGGAAVGLDRALAREFPNVTAIDIATQIAQVQRILDQVIRAVEVLFAFTLAAGLIVLFATLGLTREQRIREFALMRALGAQSRLLRQVQRTELIGTGALAGALSMMAALLIGWALARYAFGFDWAPPLWIALGGTLLGALLAWAAGWWSLREVLQRPVTESLRRAASD